MFGRSRVGILLAMMSGVLVISNLMATGAAPAAHADDPFTDIANAVEGDFALGQAEFTLANTDFASGDVADGLTSFYNGVDEYLLSVPNNLLQGSLAALLGESIDTSYSWDIPVPADFNDAIIVAPTLELIGLGDLSTAASDLAGGDIAGALDSALTGYDYLTVIVPELLVVGTAAGFGI
jgi:hypothetical protein